MREIKFRAWFKTNKVMIPHMDIQSMIHQTVCDFTLKMLYDDFIFMQYTGLKDKNGAEIYESDLLRLTSNDGQNTIVEVVWLNHGFAIRNDGFLDRTFADNTFSNRGLELEVIGNIYENSELLEL